MNNYFYNAITGEYTHCAPARIDYLETESRGETFYLRLPDCLRIEPPEPIAGKVICISETKDFWKYVDDKRGEKYFMPDDRNEYVITQLRQEKPAEALEILDLKFRREDAWQKLKSLRVFKNSEPITFSGMIFDVSAEAWENLTDAIKRLALPNPPASRNWTLADDSTVVVTAEVIQGLVAGRIDRKDTLHTASQLLRSEVNASENPEALDLQALYQVKITELGG
ncbi:MAG: DUF4376 domain-containing protein [Lentisphaeraceae bacterium]|nr:DUF4376 domain-containing protein [Lentisphaeraceae bacterium]